MLADQRVIDLSRILAGPSCTQLLADLGAEVRSRVVNRRRHPPLPGEHAAAVLAEVLGYSADDIAELERAGVIV